MSIAGFLPGKMVIQQPEIFPLRKASYILEFPLPLARLPPRKAYYIEGSLFFFQGNEEKSLISKNKYFVNICSSFGCEILRWRFLFESQKSKRGVVGRVRLSDEKRHEESLELISKYLPLLGKVVPQLYLQSFYCKLIVSEILTQTVLLVSFYLQLSIFRDYFQ